MPETDGETPQPQDTMRGRAETSSRKLWLLMEADRKIVATGLLGLVLISLVALGSLDPTSFHQSLLTADPIGTLFQGLVTAIITGVTLVVGLNQLVLSQELGPIGDQRGRMDAAMQFIQDAESILDINKSPAEPAAFLKALLQAIRSDARAVQDALDLDGDDMEPVRDYLDSIIGNADQVIEELDDVRFGTFNLLSAVLNFNYSWKIAEGRRLQHEHVDLSDTAADRMDDLLEALTLFGPTREHFKTLYFQWELVNLSRGMLYTAVPSLIIAIGMILFYDAGVVTGTTASISNDVLLTSTAVTLALAPFMLLLSYILRISTIAKRTLSIGPFVLRQDDR